MLVVLEHDRKDLRIQAAGDPAVVTAAGQGHRAAVELRGELGRQRAQWFFPGRGRMPPLVDEVNPIPFHRHQPRFHSLRRYQFRLEIGKPDAPDLRAAYAARIRG